MHCSLPPHDPQRGHCLSILNLPFKSLHPTILWNFILLNPHVFAFFVELLGLQTGTILTINFYKMHCRNCTQILSGCIVYVLFYISPNKFSQWLYFSGFWTLVNMKCWKYIILCTQSNSAILHKLLFVAFWTLCYSMLYQIKHSISCDWKFTLNNGSVFVLPWEEESFVIWYYPTNHGTGVENKHLLNGLHYSKKLLE